MPLKTVWILAALTTGAAVGCTDGAPDTEDNSPDSGLSCADEGPNAPNDVSASQAESLQVSLSWTAPADAAGYIVLRALEQDGSPTEIGRTINPEFVDTGLEPAAEHWYTLIAANSDGESCPSVPVMGTTSDSSE